MDISKFYKAFFSNQREKYAKAKSDYARHQIIAEYYKEFEPFIIYLQKQNNRLWMDSYPFNWKEILTPIEWFAWEEIRYFGIVLYPQYPVLNYRVDFGNPYLKIGLEIDGKEFHDKKKDHIRDQRIYDETGWQMFRVSGSEAYKLIDLPEYEDDRHEEYDKLRLKRLHTTMTGIIEAINEVYFDTRERDQEQWEFLQECIKALENHKLADFSIYLKKN